MPAGDPIAGLDCKLYYDSASSVASPTWVLVSKAKDVSLPESAEEVDASARYSRYKKILPGQIDNAITFGYQYITSTDTRRTPGAERLLDGREQGVHPFPRQPETHVFHVNHSIVLSEASVKDQAELCPAKLDTRMSITAADRPGELPGLMLRSSRT